MAYCYVSAMTDRYLDAQDAWESACEAYMESADYAIDMAEWVALAIEEEPDRSIPTEDDFIAYGMENYVEAWIDRRSEP